MRTAVIVNDRGEAFVGWRSHVSISVSGFETYYSVPYFAKERVFRHSEGDFWPSGVPRDELWRVDSPRVFASEQSARRSMERMMCGGQLAVVT